MGGPLLQVKVFYVKGRAGPENAKVMGVRTLWKLTFEDVLHIVITTKALHFDK